MLHLVIVYIFNQDSFRIYNHLFTQRQTYTGAGMFMLISFKCTFWLFKSGMCVVNLVHKKFNSLTEVNMHPSLN